MKPLPRRYEGIFTIRVIGNRAVDSTRPGAWAAYTKPACSYNTSSVTIRGYTFGAKKLLLMRATWKLMKENQYTFEQWNFDLGINPDGWDAGDKIPSRGWFDVDGPIVKGEPPEVVDDWPLDSDGVRAAVATYPPYEITRKPYYSRDFSVFGFTSSL